jgi:anti-sigma factor ChrR (cupin superfamily)
VELNADFSKRAVVHGAHEPWVPSPIPGVDRRMLDRIGDEVARATSIVRYAPNSRFSSHTHGGGEEFLVLDGVFQDEHGDYPVGFYIRNPPTSHHTPGSEPGCTILVKLWQFDADDRTYVRIDTGKMPFLPALDRPEVELMPLFDNERENVRLERWKPDAEIPLGDPAGIELMVLDGGFVEGDETFEPQSWLRIPPGEAATVRAGPNGCKAWVKSGHLALAQAAPSYSSEASPAS